MIPNNLGCIAIIPARAGSKGLPGKNMKILGDRKLIEYSIQLAISNPHINQIFVSSDDPSILQLTCAYPSVQFLPRPANLSQDDSTMPELIQHITSTCSGLHDENLTFILLQPTSPFRSSAEVSKAIELFQIDFPPSLVAVTRCFEHPYECVSLHDHKGTKLIDTSSARGRQDYDPNIYFISGSFYVSTFKTYLADQSFITDKTIYFPTHEPFPVDIDDSRDFSLAEALLPHMAECGYIP